MREYVPRTPEDPTTKELKEKYPQTAEERGAILAMRGRVSALLGGKSAELLVVMGPCAMTLEEDILKAEARRLANTPDILGIYRLPKMKPRTDPNAWHGLITNEPEAAYRIARDISSENANWAEEIGTDPLHLERDSDLLTLAWKGARNSREDDLTMRLALHDNTLPIAIKNSLDGETNLALEEAERIKALREHMGAGAVLLYRGGENAKTPQAWEDRLLLEDEIIDVAHGGEQSHDPLYKKSVKGQLAALDHLIRIAKRTRRVPMGVMVEASDTKSPTDPVIPFDEALERILVLAELKKQIHDSQRVLVS